MTIAEFLLVLHLAMVRGAKRAKEHANTEGEEA